MKPFCVIAIVSLALGAAACGSSTSTTSPTTSGSITTVNINGQLGSSSYAPNPVTVKVGTQVNWLNKDTITHTATADNGSFNVNPISAMSAQGAPVTMNTVGTFAYHCSIHPTMVGSIVVTP